MNMVTRQPSYQVDVSLDASAVDKREAGSAVKVAAVTATGKVVTSTTVKLDARGQARASLTLPVAAGATRVLVGGADVADADLPGLQTLYVDLPRAPQGVVKLPAIRISNYYWQLWLRWCRNFVVRGRLVCANGSPIPGAVVNAYDVDAFWWWTSFQTLGQATTDSNGEFEIHFRWCCGLWPWWWWRLRNWSLDPDLVSRLEKYLQARPELPVPPRPSPLPDLSVFNPWLKNGTVIPTPVVRPPVPTVPRLSQAIDPTQLTTLRTTLVQRLPVQRDPGLLNIWPWCVFEPWNDCSPDLVFRVSQACNGEQKLIINESRAQARWNIGTDTQVTLVASDSACCVGDIPPTQPHCATPLGVCGLLGEHIGGNTGALASPVGYYDPGNEDAPFAGVLRIEGDIGVDYYSFQVAQVNGGPLVWNDVAPLSTGGFTRYYWDAPSTSYVNVPFNFELLDGRWVMESRAHYEATHFPGDWGTFHNHIWLTPDLTSLMHWLTDGNYADGTWALQLVGYDRSGNTLTPRGAVPLCGTENHNPPTPSQLLVTLDNRQPGTADVEPKADVVNIFINGAVAGPCSMVDAKAGGTLDVDLVAYDIDGHLDSFTLMATWGKDMPPIDLLALSGATLTPMAQGSVPAADFVGNTYAKAKVEGAPAPIWKGGGMRLHIPDLHGAFPQTCCYQIELRVYNRTIVNCDGSLPFRAFSYYSLTVQV
jgi:hypothetical protein